MSNVVDCNLKCNWRFAVASHPQGSVVILRYSSIGTLVNLGAVRNRPCKPLSELDKVLVILAPHGLFEDNCGIIVFLRSSDGATFPNKFGVGVLVWVMDHKSLACLKEPPPEATQVKNPRDLVLTIPLKHGLKGRQVPTDSDNEIGFIAIRLDAFNLQEFTRQLLVCPPIEARASVTISVVNIVERDNTSVVQTPLHGTVLDEWHVRDVLVGTILKTFLASRK